MTIRNRVKLFMTSVEKARKGADSTVPVLAQVHATLVAAKTLPAHMKPSADPLQLDFFGGAKPLQKE